jgi:cholecystokinin A receptor
MEDLADYYDLSTLISASSSHVQIESMPNEDCVFRPTTENYVMIVAFCVIFCLSVVGNSVVVVVILQQKSMRSITNYYLLNLAFSDLLLSVVCMPPTLVSSLVYCWVFGNILCKLLAYLQPVVVTASAWTLASIALERYYAICKPLHSRMWHTRSHAFAVIGLVWLVSIIANFMMLFMYELRGYNRTGINCAPKYSPAVHFGYQIYMTVVLLVIPLLVMTALYGSVIKTLRSGIRMDIAAIEMEGCNEALKTEDSTPSAPYSARSVGSFIGSVRSKRSRAPWMSLVGDGSQQSNGNDTSRRSFTVENSLRSTHSSRTALAKQRLIRMLIVIVIIFFCCWTPSYIWWLMLNAQDVFKTFNVWNSELNTFITVLTYLSSCTNPITYCFLNSKFRNALFLSFGCRSSTLRSHFQRVHDPSISIHQNTQRSAGREEERSASPTSQIKTGSSR